MSESKNHQNVWEQTTQKVSKSIVAIETRIPFSIDEQYSFTSKGTGIVVDAENGLILTCKHGVPHFPWYGNAVTSNSKRLACEVAYVDPIHDFTFLRVKESDRSALEGSVPLCPSKAKAGLSIRVLGNHSGEGTSIFTGTVNKVDGNCRHDRDFNTNYIQTTIRAGKGTSGGAGICEDGSVIGIVTNTDLAQHELDLLPVDAPLRILQSLQRGADPVRGDIGVKFELVPFHECSSLGLQADQESEFRQKLPDQRGLLVIKCVQVDGPAFKLLREGDILIRVNNTLVAHLSALDELLDSLVGRVIRIELRRHGEVVEVEVAVRDLFLLVPNRVAKVGGAVFNEISLNVAMKHGLPMKGVYLCEPEGSFDLTGWEEACIVTSLDGIETPDLEEFIKAAKKIPHGRRVPVSWKAISSLNQPRHTVIQLDRKWNPVTIWTKKQASYNWEVDQTDDGQLPRLGRASLDTLDETGFQLSRPLGQPPFVVHINCVTYETVDGSVSGKTAGIGLVVDKALGLILVLQTTIPHALCDVTAAFGAETFKCTVSFIHPTQGYSIVRCSELKSRISIQDTRLSTAPLKVGDATTFLTWEPINGSTISKTTVSAVKHLSSPVDTKVPRYRIINTEGICVNDPTAEHSDEGVLMGKDDDIQGLWMDVDGKSVGIYASLIAPVVASLKAGNNPTLRSLECELEPVTVLDACTMGVDLAGLKELPPVFYQVRKCFTRDRGYEGGCVLQEGDIIVKQDGQIVQSVSAFDPARLPAIVHVTVLRAGKEMLLELHPATLDCLGTTSVAAIAGLVVQQPHYSVRQQCKTSVPSEVYISGRWHSLPHSDGLRDGAFVLDVGGKPTTDIETFLRVTNHLPDSDRKFPKTPPIIYVLT